MPPAASASPPDKTDWPRVAVLIAAGIAAAVHIGKVPGALPVLTGELKLDLSTAALITAIYSLVSALAGLFFGVSASRLGAKPLVVGAGLFKESAQ
jgi:MFS family permease